MAPETLRRIFEPFFTTKDINGTGLGLWVSLEIVQKHGGMVKVRSRAGAGTIFSIFFPLESRLSTSEIPSAVVVGAGQLLRMLG